MTYKVVPFSTIFLNMQVRTIILLLLLYSIEIFAQDIFINEYLASNVTDYPEMYDFDDYTDWIELHNPGATLYSLDGFFLTDNLEDPLKWKVPDGTLIESEGYLIIWADDYDETPGQVYMRPYWPWDDFTTRHYHTNFKISKNGEELGLFKFHSNRAGRIVEIS